MDLKKTRERDREKAKSKSNEDCLLLSKETKKCLFLERFLDCFESENRNRKKPKKMQQLFKQQPNRLIALKRIQQPQQY